MKKKKPTWGIFAEYQNRPAQNDPVETYRLAGGFQSPHEANIRLEYIEGLRMAPFGFTHEDMADGLIGCDHDLNRTVESIDCHKYVAVERECVLCENMASPKQPVCQPCVASYHAEMDKDPNYNPSLRE